MPEKQTIEEAKEDLRQGKAPSTAAGEFVREEMHHVGEGKHGARSRQQAVAIGLSKARRAGVPLKPPGRGRGKPRTRASAKRAYEVGQGKRKPRSTSKRRSRAIRGALKREGRPKLRGPGSGARASARRSAQTRARLGTGRGRIRTGGRARPSGRSRSTRKGRRR
jgi:hypothetical protein